MVGISIACTKEWECVLERFGLSSEDCGQYPFGEYFKKELYGEEVIIYKCGSKKANSSAAAQYMIDHFQLPKIIVAGTCAGIDPDYNTLDIMFPDRLVQYDCNIPGFGKIIKDSLSVYIDTDSHKDLKTGTIGTADKPVVLWSDYNTLKYNGITVADTESAAIAYVCRANGVECVVVKGISDYPEEVIGPEDMDLIMEQYNTFVANIPIIMNDIFDNYLEYALKNRFNWKSHS